MKEEEFKNKAEKAKKLMDELKIFLKAFNKFKEENKNDEKLVTAISMATLTVLLDNMTENPFATIGLLEAIKINIVTDTAILEELDTNKANYIG